MAKVSVQWVPRNVSTQDRQHSLHSSRELVSIYGSDPEGYLFRLVTGDETWLSQYDLKQNNSLSSGGIRGPPSEKIQDAMLGEESDGDSFLRRKRDPTD